MLSQSRPAKIKSFNYQLSAALKYITAEIWNTKGTQNNTCRRSWWRQWNDRKSCGETNFVQVFRSVQTEIRGVWGKKRSFTTASAKNFRFCSKRGAFIHEQRSDQNILVTLIYCSFMTHFMTKKIWKKRNVTLDPRHSLVSSVVQAKLLDCCYGFMSKFVQTLFCSNSIRKEQSTAPLGMRSV